MSNLFSLTEFTLFICSDDIGDIILVKKFSDELFCFDDDDSFCFF